MQENELKRVMKGEEYFVDSKGRKQGLWLSTKGNKGRQTCEYKDNKRNGVFQRISSKGVVLESVEYVMDKRDGYREENFANKKSIAKEMYYNGQICGEVAYYQQGTLHQRELRIGHTVIRVLGLHEVLDREEEVIYALKHPGMRFLPASVEL